MAAATDSYLGSAGIAVVTLDAFNAGIGSVPNPETDADWDGWLWYSKIQLMGGITGDGAVAGVVRTEIDSKAMRKVRINDVIIGVHRYVEVGTAVLISNAATRFLFKLP